MANGLRFKTARDLFLACPAAARDMRTLPTEQHSIEFCRDLLAGRVPEEAITFCAYLLPDRAAVWWAHECLGHLSELLDETDQQLLALVSNWVSEPGSAHHRAALGQAAAVPPTTRAPGLPWLRDGVIMALVLADPSAEQQYHPPHRRVLPPMPSMPEFWQGWRVLHSRTVLPFYLPLSKWVYRWPRSRRCANQRTHASLSCSLSGLKARGKTGWRECPGVALAETA